MIVIFFMHWIVSSSGIGMVGMTDADTAQGARLLRPGLADEMGSVLGLESFISGKKILYHTLFSYPIFCSEYHRTVSLSHVIEAGNLSQCAQCPLLEKGNLLSVSPRHPLTASTSSTNRKLYFQNFKTSTSKSS